MQPGVPSSSGIGNGLTPFCAPTYPWKAPPSAYAAPPACRYDVMRVTPLRGDAVPTGPATEGVRRIEFGSAWTIGYAACASATIWASVPVHQSATLNSFQSS